MNKINIHKAFRALGGPTTKEDVVIEVARQTNIRFNDLPALQEQVDDALDECLSMGFVERNNGYYEMTTVEPSQIESDVSLEATNSITSATTMQSQASSLVQDNMFNLRRHRDSSRRNNELSSTTANSRSRSRSRSTARNGTRSHSRSTRDISSSSLSNSSILGPAPVGSEAEMCYAIAIAKDLGICRSCTANRSRSRQPSWGSADRSHEYICAKCKKKIQSEGNSISMSSLVSSDELGPAPVGSEAELCYKIAVARDLGLY